MLTALAFLAGLALLVVGADALVRGARSVALRVGVSPLVAGLTVVALGTSAPELAVSVGAVVNDQGDLAVGNVVGSNIFNILVLLGISALVTPLLVEMQVIRQEVPLMIGASVLLIGLVLDGSIGLVDGIVLTVLLVAYTVGLIVQSSLESRRRAASDAAGDAEDTRSRPIMVDLALIIAGLGGLVLGSRWLVQAAVDTASAFGVSELIIGLTIVSAGTSLPEVATSVTAAVRGERDMAVGNAIGSSTFNVLGVLGVSGIASTWSAAGGLEVPDSVMAFDVWVMLAVMVACLPVFISGRTIGRWEGVLFLGYYAAYTGYLVLAASDHDRLDDFSLVMGAFVIPLTVAALVVSAFRPHRAPAPPG